MAEREVDSMMESCEFMISLIMCLVFIAVPVGGAGFIFHQFGKNQDKSLN